MKIVYDLRTDHPTIAAMQRGSRGPGPVGLRVTHGIVGSPEWWAYIDEGQLPVHRVSGVVSGFWPGQWGGGPAEFEMQGTDGATSHWLCNLETRRARAEFRLGRAVEVRFVIQELKTTSAGRATSEVEIAILLGE